MKRISVAFMLILLVYLAMSGCNGDDDPVSSAITPAKILILEDGGSEDSLFKILDSAGFDVTMGGLYHAYTGTDFSGFDLVIILNGLSFTTVMPDSVQQGIKSFVNGGGVLLMTEYLVWYGNQVIIDSLGLVTSNAGLNDGYEAYLKQLDHPISAGLPDSFDLDWDGYWVTTNPKPTSLCTNIQTIYNGVSAASPQILIGDFGSGKVIHWGMCGECNGADTWSSVVRRLFINIATFSQSI